MTETAVNTLILRRPTHLDSLLERLKEERVRKIISPLISGGDIADKTSDDYLYTRDLGLIREAGRGLVEPANQIYAEIMVRYLSYTLQEELLFKRPDDDLPKYIVNGKIDISALIKEFQQFWRENSEIWVEKYKTNFYQYDEAAPHLVFQGFLQRVINGGGQIHREMALGTRRADLCVIYDDQKYPIELKILHSSQSLSEGLAQIQTYMDKVGADTGWLVMFDRNANKPWDEKIYMKTEVVNGKNVVVAGC